jgi:hypothetical protein
LVAPPVPPRGQSRRGQFAQLFVNERQKVLGGVPIASVDR